MTKWLWLDRLYGRLKTSKYCKESITYPAEIKIENYWFPFWQDMVSLLRRALILQVFKISSLVYKNKKHYDRNDDGKSRKVLCLYSIHDRTLQIAQRDVAGGKCVNISTVGTLVSL